METIITEEIKRNIYYYDVYLSELEKGETINLEDGKYEDPLRLQHLLNYIDLNLTTHVDFVSEYPQKISHLFTLSLTPTHLDWIYRFYLPLTSDNIWITSNRDSYESVDTIFTEEIDYDLMENDGIKIRIEKSVVPNDSEEAKEKNELPYKQINFDFYVDSEMYYDSEKGITVIDSNDKSEKALLVPFNSIYKEDRRLTFDFTLMCEYPLSYEQIQAGYDKGNLIVIDIHIDNELNNEKKLIGKEGKYHFANYK